MIPSSQNAFPDALDGISPHLAGWVEASGDLWKSSGLLAKGPFQQAVAEELLDRHVEQFAECFDNVNEGAPARSAGGPCQILEQVGNRGGHAGPETVKGGLCPDLGGSLDGPRPVDRDRGGLRDRGAALLRDLARSWGARGPGAAPEAFGRRAYSAASPEHCQAGAWSLGLVSRATGEWQVWRFRCRSWRCPKCAPAVNRRDAERIEDALGPVPLDQVLFLTFTFDRERYASSGDAWRASRDCWKRLRDTLAYRYGEGAGRSNRKATLVYVQTWEQHKDGWPHVHVLLWSREIASDVRRRGSYQRLVRGEPRPIWRWSAQVLRQAALSAGFGPILDAQFPRRERGALAGYLVKIAAELTGSAKKDQTPVNAPKGFRRIRATPKFLEPARRSTGEWIGQLLLAPFDQVVEELERGAETMHAAAEVVKGRIERWLRPTSVPSAECSSTRADSPRTEALCTQ